MDTIKQNDTGAAVEDIQQRLSALGYLDPQSVSGLFDEATVKAVQAFCRDCALEPTSEVTAAVWAKLVDASYEMGDRVLYLRVPFFHGHDVKVLQQALSSLGFSCGTIDGIFGVHTEDALRKFQFNMGLPSDGIAGSFTFQALRNLHHSWKGRDSFRPAPHLGFARAAEVLEENLLCLFGTQEFTRSVAARMSNLALATNPISKVMSAESLLVAPDEAMLFVQILVQDETPAIQVPVVEFEPENSLSFRLTQAFRASKNSTSPDRIAVRLPSDSWKDAGKDRSAQHFAIVLLDALCAALSELRD